MDVTIYHNPDCGTSRNTLAMIRAAGIEPEIVLYLETPLTLEELRRLFARTGAPVRSLLRRKDTPYDRLGLDDPAISDEQILNFVAEHPILMNRPIVTSDTGAALCRPSEAVVAMLPAGSLPPTFTKEDGEVVVFPKSGQAA